MYALNRRMNSNLSNRCSCRDIRSRITSGLVGGGMMAGVAVAAAPAVIGGYLGYKVFKKIFS